MAKKSGHNPQKHGNWAQWATVAVALLGSTGVNVYFHYAESSAKTSDEHVKGLIADALSPKVKEIDDRLEKVSSDVSKLTADIHDLQKAVKTLADNQPKEIQKIIDRSIGAARTASPSTASKLLDTATSLLTVARNERVPADPGYFQQIVAEFKGLSSPRVFPSVFSAKLALASYRSALELPTSLPPTTQVQTSAIHLTNSKHARIAGMKFNLNQGASAVRLEPIRWDDEIVVTQSVINNGSQVLDGIHWRDVVFIGTRLRYEGGGVELNNVRFVNCTFDFSQTQHAAQVAEYAAVIPWGPFTIGE